MEKHTFIIKKEVFENTQYKSIENCALSTTVRERLHPDREVRTGYGDVDVRHEGGGFFDGYEFSYIVSNKDVEKVHEAYDNPRNIKVTFTRVK